MTRQAVIKWEANTMKMQWFNGILIVVYILILLQA